ncbi:MDL1 (YLR188W) [Zygosaccharomyces parabailii]|nr:MDL1 (YLR188W) [Zygosaccharomyces parabailii]CDH13330.1 probable ATP-dependent permease MDL1,mitochondrial [Zygosaccharomyces bailii ISA1307]
MFAFLSRPLLLQKCTNLGIYRRLMSGKVLTMSLNETRLLTIRRELAVHPLKLATHARWKSDVTNEKLERRPGDTKEVLKLSSSEKNASGFQDIARLFRLAKPEVWYIAGALCLIVVSSAVSMIIPTIVGKLLDLAKASSPSEGAEEGPEKENNGDGTIYGLTPEQFCVVMCGIFVIGALANCGRIIILKVTGERLVARLRTRTMKAALGQDSAFLDRNRVGDLISRLSSDASLVAKSVTQNVSDGTRAIIQGLVGFSMMSYISWQLTCVMGLMIPPIGAMALIYGKKIRNLSRQLQTSVGGLTKVAEEQLGATKTIQSYVGEKKEIRRYAKEVRHVFDIGLKEAITSGLFFGSTGFVGNISLLALLMTGTTMIQNGMLTVGDLSSFMMYAVYTGSSMFGLSNFYSELMKGAGAAARVFELNDRKPAIPPTLGKGPVSIRNQPISFSDVSFTYPTRPNRIIFNHLNLKVQPGEHVCIAGPSGSGKSTIASLLLRYYDVDHGSICIGGKDIRSFNLRKYRRLVSIVHQEPMLFNGSILENITYAVPESVADDQHRVAIAIGQANCSKFLANFPDGLETLVGPRGTQLSGGQKQRIALARAFLLDPALLVLDEATSALDSQSEEVVARALQQRVKRGLTTISIAHRISTIAHSTRVVVLGKQGSVVESGAFSELIGNPDSELNILLSEQQEKSEEEQVLPSKTKTSAKRD